MLLVIFSICFFTHVIYIHNCITRFLPAYHAEMVALGAEDAEQMRKFFTVHRSQLPFSGTAMDQCIEQTVNKSCKSSGGIQGVTLNPGIFEIDGPRLWLDS